MLNLALHGIISVTDKRVEVIESATDETEDVIDEFHENDYIPEKETTKEKE